MTRHSAIGTGLFAGLVILTLCALCSCSELLFTLEAKDEMCFYEYVKKGERTVLEYQVVDGGSLDCDLVLHSPSGKELYNERQKQYDSFMWTTEEDGVFKWCFSNKFSTITSKKIYFDFVAGDEPEFISQQAGAGVNTAMTALEMSLMSVHESLKVIEDYQKHFRLREMSGRAFAEEVNFRVSIWSLAEFFIIILTLLSQVYTVRSFFADKKDRQKMAT